MDSNLQRIVDSILTVKEGEINAIYLYGSYVNGYYRKDSDKDLVVVGNKISEKPINYPPNISVHYVTPTAMTFFETGRSYAHLRMIPIYNEEKCREISDDIKSELVRREIIRFKRKNIWELDVLTPINNFLLGYAIERPWRIKPIKRIFASEETQKILREEYKKIFRILEQRSMIEGLGEDRYIINKNYLFDEKTGPAKVKEGLEFKVRNSYFGWYYLINFLTMLCFAKRRI